MKIRVKIPDALAADYYGARNDKLTQQRQDFVDEILMWGMETEMDIAFYSFYWPAGHKWGEREMWVVFTVETDFTYMFSLKWGALLHKRVKVVSKEKR